MNYNIFKIIIDIIIIINIIIINVKNKNRILFYLLSREIISNKFL